MMTHDSEPTGRKAHDVSTRHASIPGDPFPWEPEETGSPTILGATPSPADSGDPSSFDLGGGD